MWLLMLVLVGQPGVQLDELKSLDASERLERARGRYLLGQAIIRLREDKKLSAQDREELLRQVVRLMPSAARTPTEVRSIMGPESTPTIARQLYFRRVLEQWRFDQFDGLVIVFESFLGQELRLQQVRVPPTP